MGSRNTSVWREAMARLRQMGLIASPMPKWLQAVPWPCLPPHSHQS